MRNRLQSNAHHTRATLTTPPSPAASAAIAMLSRLSSRARNPLPSTKPIARDASAAVGDLRQLLAAEPLLASSSALSAWADDECLLRYLRARDADAASAATSLRHTLAWRKARAMPWLPARTAPVWAALRREAETGKMFVLPRRSRDGRAVVVMRPGLENTSDPQGQMTFLAYTLERAAAVAADGGGDAKFIIICDYAAGQFSLKNSPSISTSKTTLSMLQDHYPERLGKALLFDAPAFFYAVFRAIKPFIDPVTSEKIAWCSRATAASDVVCTSSLEPSNTPEEYGGTLQYEFNVDEYFGGGL